jgi:BspA type Leucine rich repeat region (6 copies)/Secretion system C-terminal sorting domain
MKKGLLIILSYCFSIMTIGQVNKTISNTVAGGLSTNLTRMELKTVTNLTVKGVIDSRDFKTMRDSMPSLTIINLDSVNIDSYTGTNGTDGDTLRTYLSNSIPKMAFAFLPKLISITLPSSITSIGASAFATDYSLVSITIPSTVTHIGEGAFFECMGLLQLIVKNPIPITGNDFGEGGIVFYEIPSNGTMFVPQGTLKAYQDAFLWNRFPHIVEGNGGELNISAESIYVDAIASDTASFTVMSNQAWQLNCDSTWLSFNSTSGYDTAKIIVSTTHNIQNSERKATVIIKSTNVPEQTITITQKSSTTYIRTENLSNICLYPNPATYYFTVNIKNKCFVQVYKLDGQMIISNHNLGIGEKILIGNISKGLYLVKITTGNFLSTQKLMVE